MGPGNQEGQHPAVSEEDVMSTTPTSPPAAIDDVAARLVEAARSGVPIAPVKTLLAEGDVRGAYAVQQRVTAHRLEGGRRVVGRKIGLTSIAVQRQLGVDQP